MLQRQEIEHVTVRVASWRRCRIHVFSDPEKLPNAVLGRSWPEKCILGQGAARLPATWRICFKSHSHLHKRTNSPLTAMALVLVDRPKLVHLLSHSIILQKIVALHAYVGHLQTNVGGRKEISIYCCQLMLMSSN